MSEPKNKAMTEINPAEAVLAGVCYADCFDFAPKRSELGVYIPFWQGDPASIEQQTRVLVDAGRLIERDEYLALPGRESLVEDRRRRAPIVAEKWDLIHRYLPTILDSPWIKAVLLTGSLAARNPTDRADADLFLILDSRRMWLGYLIIRLWFRYRKHIEFCPNYAISEKSLALLFPNYFTAVELSMAIPLKTGPELEALEQRNRSLRDLVPNALTLQEKAVIVPPKRTVLGRLTAVFLASPLGWLLDRMEYYRLRAKTQGRYLPGESIYKPHPPTRQYMILKAFKERLDRRHVELPVLTDHLREQFEILEEAIDRWGIRPEELKAAVERNKHRAQVNNKVAVQN